MRPVEAGLILLELRKNQWLGSDELESIQLRKLNDLLLASFANVPHYSTLSGTRMRDISELRLLPILTKESVRRRPDSFISSGYPKASLIRNHTSGSSGFQVPLYTSRAEEAYGIAFECHHLLENGIGLLERQAKITHFSSAPNLLQRMGMLRCDYISVLETENRILEQLKEKKASVLSAYPSVVRSLALSNRGLRLKMVLTGGELLHRDVRRLAEKSFGCPVRDRYGSMETSWVAWECEKGSCHVHSDQAIVEIVGERGEPLPDGRVGRIIVTPLWRKAMPFIRYDIGDRGALGGKCGCGRGLQVLSRIEGRDDDFIVLPSGKVRSARTINIMDDIEEVLSYQIVQERQDHFVFRHVPSGGGLRGSTRAEIARRISSGCLGENVRVEFEEVTRMDRGRTGKIRTVISKVKPDAD